MRTQLAKPIVGLALTLALLAASSQAVVAAERWQYATLLVTGTFTFRTGGKTFSAETVRQFPDFYKNVTGQPFSGKPDLGEETVSALLDGLGAAGWELVHVDTAQSGARTFYFKRS